MGHPSAPFALMVRFTVREGSENAFDELTRRTLSRVRTQEPGTLIYACHRVQGKPQQRIFYELYHDRGAFDDHESQDYVEAFLAEREAYLTSTEVDVLQVADHKGAPVAEVSR